MMQFVFSSVATMLLSVIVLVRPAPVVAQVTQSEEFFRAKVVEIVEEGEQEMFGTSAPFQVVHLMPTEDVQSEAQIKVLHGQDYSIDASRRVSVGDIVVVASMIDPMSSERVYQIAEPYRLDTLLTLVLVFFLAVIGIARWQGVGSIIGLALSIAVIAGYIIPGIIDGRDPLWTSVSGAVMIMLTTIYLAHGFSKRTTLALLATTITLVGIGVLAALCIVVFRLSGFGSEDAYSLKLGAQLLNFRGLLLGGIIIGALGVLDDITTSLCASVHEISRANPAYRARELFKSGIVIGREHVVSLVNTLALAYIGVSLPLFIMLALNPNQYPLWVILNSEMMVEEIMRTLVGSMGLLAAVPITAALAAFSFGSDYTANSAHAGHKPKNSSA
jgi:uncharacterized membrane protein